MSHTDNLTTNSHSPNYFDSDDIFVIIYQMLKGSKTYAMPSAYGRVQHVTPFI